MTAVPLAASGPARAIALPILVLLYWIPYDDWARALARERRPVPSWR